jgi:pimeloyl-ACP methyl ester carboxylesterase
VSPSRPFRRGAFGELPPTPRVPHRFWETKGEEVVVPTAALGDVTLHVRTAGEGRPLLLVHGLMTSSYSFRHVVDRLARTHRVVVPDLPGAGRSPAAAGPLTPVALVEVVLGLIDTLGIRGCLCVGNSMGGYLCLRAALADPGGFAALVDVHSPGVPLRRLWALHAAMSTGPGKALFDALVRIDPRRWVHRNVHYRDESLKSLEEAEEYGAPLRTRAGRDAFGSYLRDALDPRPMRDLVRELERRRSAGTPFPIPLALLYSTEDPMVPPLVGRELGRLIPSAEMIWMEETSHFCHVDTPDRFIDATLDFFRRVAPPG